jgi:hypothetical protein
MGRNTLTYMGFITLECIVLFLVLSTTIKGVSDAESSLIQNIHSAALSSMVAIGVLTGWCSRAGPAQKQTLAWSGIPMVVLILFAYLPSSTVSASKIVRTQLDPIVHPC